MSNVNMILCEPIPGSNPQGLFFVECRECSTRYPLSNGEQVMFNGSLYDDCPCCRPAFDEKYAQANAELAEGAVF